MSNNPGQILAIFCFRTRLKCHKSNTTSYLADLKRLGNIRKTLKPGGDTQFRRNDFFAIVAKNYVKVDIKVFCSSLIFLEFSTFFHIYMSIAVVKLVSTLMKICFYFCGIFFISPSIAFHPSASQMQTQSSMLPIQPLPDPHAVYTVWLPRQSTRSNI